MGVGVRIERFLDAHPGGALDVLAGYASGWGLQWLSQRAGEDRPVNLVIGSESLTADYFNNSASQDIRRDVLGFLDRPDVRVLHCGELHSKAWVVRRNGQSFVLAGSANLTRRGFHPARIENIGEYRAGSSDAEDVCAKVREAVDGAQDAKPLIRLLLDGQAAAVRNLLRRGPDDTPAGPEGAVSRLELICSDVGAPRDEQLDMARAVYGALASNRPTVVQLGTGGGKSFAYLAGALAAAAGSSPLIGDRRIVISTHTNTLIDQLCEDLAELQQDGKLDGKIWRQLKGVTQYACVAEAKQILKRRDNPQQKLDDEPSATEAAAEAAERVLRMAAPEAALSSLHVTDPEAAKIKRTSSSCSTTSCSSWKKCHGKAARAQARDADIVVTNHALALTDAHLGDNPLLGEYRFLIVDEVHALPSAAEGYADMSVSASEIREVGKSARRYAPGAGDAAKRAARSLVGFVDEIRRSPKRRQPGHSPDQRGTGDGRVGHGLKLDDQPDLGDFFDLPRCLQTEMGEYLDIRSVKLHESDYGPYDQQKTLAAKLAFLRDRGLTTDNDLHLEKTAARVDDLTERVGSLREAPPRGSRKAMHVSHPGNGSGGRGRGLCLSDYDTAGVCAPLLGEHRWAAASATVTDALPEAIGAGDASMLNLGYPMDYGRNAKMVVFGEKPEYDKRTESFPPRPGTWAQMLEMMEAAGGRALLLFASWDSLNNAHSYMAPRTGLRLLRQPKGGSASVPSVIAEFADNPGSCLFGVKSLWEGVDVPGPTCSLVIVDRLPNLPLGGIPVICREEAGETYEDMNRSYVTTMLTQGWGRLLRHLNDQGVLAIADPRPSAGRRDAVEQMGLTMVDSVEQAVDHLKRLTYGQSPAPHGDQRQRTSDAQTT